MAAPEIPTGPIDIQAQLDKWLASNTEAQKYSHEALVRAGGPAGSHRMHAQDSTEFDDIAGAGVVGGHRRHQGIPVVS